MIAANSNGTSEIGCTENSREKQTLADNRENRGSTFLVYPLATVSNGPLTCPLHDHPQTVQKGLAGYANKILATPTSEFPVQYDSLRASQCKRGLEEACKFLSGDTACIDATDNGNMSVAMKKRCLKVGIDAKEQQGPFYGLRGMKNHGREELCERERKFNKLLAASMKEIEV